MSSEIGLDADHRADPSAFARAKERDHTVHGAMVGKRQGRLPQSLGALDQLVDATQAVEKRKLRVDVEVDEVFGHGRVRVTSCRWQVANKMVTVHPLFPSPSGARMTGEQLHTMKVDFRLGKCRIIARAMWSPLVARVVICCRREEV